MKKLYIENCHSCYRLFMQMITVDGLQLEITSDHKAADIIVFSGGCDIHPRHYGETNERGLSYPAKIRDDFCDVIWNDIEKKGKKAIGICRGAQLIAAKLGAKLYQDIRGHKHEKMPFHINSMHHQAIIPDECLGKIYHYGINDAGYSGDGKVRLKVKNVESFYNGRFFGVQWHPEYMHGYKDNEAVMWFVEMVKELIK